MVRGNIKRDLFCEQLIGERLYVLKHGEITTQEESGISVVNVPVVYIGCSEQVVPLVSLSYTWETVSYKCFGNPGTYVVECYIPWSDDPTQPYYIQATYSDEHNCYIIRYAVKKI